MLINISKGLHIDVDCSRLNADVQDHVFAIGLRNILMDAHAGETQEKWTTPEMSTSDVTAAVRKASLARSTAKLDAMYAGDLRKNREGGTRTTDPLEMAIKETVRAMLKGKYKKGQEEDFRAEFELQCENQDVIAAAKETLAIRERLNHKKVTMAIVREAAE